MVSKYNKFIFLLPPKTASTSFTKCLIDSGIKLSNPIKNTEYPQYHLTLSELTHCYDITNEEIKDYKIIQIVRNPYDRFISAWIHQKEILGYDIKLDELISKLNQYKKLLPNNINSFYVKFYNTIQFKYKSFSEGNWGGCRFWYEQNWWNDINMHVEYFKLEDIKINITPISDYIGIKLNPLEKIKQNPNSYRKEDYRYYYTENNMNIIKSLYINDIEKYEYEF